MVYVIAVVASLAILIYGIYAQYKRRPIRRMAWLAECVKVEVYRRLRLRYEEEYGEDSGFLVAAVTNELFSAEPGNEKGVQYLESNRPLVDEQIELLRDDADIQVAVVQALRVLAVVRWGKDRDTALQISEPLQNLKRRGMIPKDLPAPNPNTFEFLVKEFVSDF